MTRKHFRAIANIINTYHDKDEMVDMFTALLILENPNFDEGKFREACYPHLTNN